MSLYDQIKDKKMIFFLGSGGVGKTTLSAATALHLSQTKKTLVVTVDPAKRLASSLGLKMMGNKVNRINDNLDALMIDTKFTMDEMTTRYAPTPEAGEKILKNNFYQHLSDAFTGSEEFVAIGKLYDLFTDGKYETIVVDTAPSKHGIDFISYSNKLKDLFDSGVAKWLSNPTSIMGRITKKVMKAFAAFTSEGYINDVSEFFSTFDFMLPMMKERVIKMDELVKDPSVSVCNLVTSATLESIEAGLTLHEEIVDCDLPFGYAVVNRATVVADDIRQGYGKLVGDEAMKKSLAGIMDSEVDPFVSEEQYMEHIDQLGENLRRTIDVADTHAAHIQYLKGKVDEVYVVPQFDTSIYDIAGLEKLNEKMFG